MISEELPKWSCLGKVEQNVWAVSKNIQMQRQNSRQKYTNGSGAFLSVFIQPLRWPCGDFNILEYFLFFLFFTFFAFTIVSQQVKRGSSPPYKILESTIKFMLVRCLFVLFGFIFMWLQLNTERRALLIVLLSRHWCSLNTPTSKRSCYLKCTRIFLCIWTLPSNLLIGLYCPYSLSLSVKTLGNCKNASVSKQLSFSFKCYNNSLMSDALRSRQAAYNIFVCFLDNLYPLWVIIDT